ncbi:MAG: hypothetical protein VX836_15275 [Pseudomonadota bacterium]|jgi:hypothetical protein|nr:hypothetical protein [Pseudomonadota bacterium]
MIASAPIDHPLNLLTQTILTAGSYAVWVGMMVLAIRMGIRQRTPFFVLILLAAAFGGIFEPLYDEGLALWFYAPGQWTAYTSFGIPQPAWVYSGYVTLYGATALFICDRIGKGEMTRGLLYKWAGVEFVCSCAFEMIGINGGAYEYWGPHVFRVFEYPLVIGVLETAQVICFSLAAAELRRRSQGWMSLLGLFVLFPCTFYFANFGAGAPTIVALHLDQPSALLVTIATTISIVFSLLLIRACASLLPVGAKNTTAFAGNKQLAT